MSDIGLAGIGAAIGAAVAGLFAWLVQRSKGGTDVEVAAIGEWQKLYNALSKRVSDLEKQLADVRREHADEVDQTNKRHREEIKVQIDRNNALKEQNEGLKRQIAQNSRSTAAMLSRTPVTKDKSDE